MNNRERFVRTIDWQPVDRILTYDLLDNSEILVQHGGYDPARTYGSKGPIFSPSLCAAKTCPAGSGSQSR